jgi:hypothetical protein
MRKSISRSQLHALTLSSSRAFHSAGMALIGACGFLVSAVISPHAYKVRQRQKTSRDKHLLMTLGSLRMSYLSHYWSFLLHPALTRLAFSKSTRHSSRRHRHCFEHCMGNTWANHGCMDLQSLREAEGLSYWPLGQRRVVILCHCGLLGAEDLLPVSKQEDTASRYHG